MLKMGGGGNLQFLLTFFQFHLWVNEAENFVKVKIFFQGQPFSHKNQAK